MTARELEGSAGFSRIMELEEDSWATCFTYDCEDGMKKIAVNQKGMVTRSRMVIKRILIVRGVSGRIPFLRRPDGSTTCCCQLSVVWQHTAWTATM